MKKGLCPEHITKYLLSLMILQVFLIIAGDDLLSQDVQSGPVRQQAFEAFSRGDFKNAYSGFSELLNTYSKDPLYKYYSGVCLVHLEQDPHMAAALLSDATSEANIVRAVPSDVLFWLGRAY
ncbi:MAG: hypothetical protein GX999_04400, partial [Bacteroidales bacterium]|nr:hypothetical protein [Bacteroidales bacterium]